MLHLHAGHNIIFKAVRKVIISVFSFMYAFIHLHIFLKVQVLCNRL